jgi:hypothetical protein
VRVPEHRQRVHEQQAFRRQGSSRFRNRFFISLTLYLLDSYV